MPGFTLRLTDEQHAKLTAAAKDNHRSLQGEVIHRLFPPHPYDTQNAIDRARAIEREAKPDPKPRRK